MHTGDARQLGFEMCDCARIGIIGIEIAEGAAEQGKEFGLAMIPLRANLDQFHKISRGLHAQIIRSNTAESFAQSDFRECVQIRFTARRDLNFRFEKQIQSAGKRTFGASRPFRDGLNAAERFRAPRNNEAGIAELPFAQQDCRCALHPSNLARPSRIRAADIDLRRTGRHIQLRVLQRNPFVMPEEETIERAREDEREGKAPSTQAGEFVREEMEHIREGEHGARSPQQAIAIGLSKARRAGVKLPPPKKGKASARTRKQAKRDLKRGRNGGRKKPSRTRSRASKRALKREGRRSASKRALSRQAKRAARRRSAANRSRAARKAARTRKQRRR